MDIERRAERARAILSDSVFTEALTAIRERQLSAFASSAPDKPQEREQAHQMLMAINQLEVELRQAIGTESIKNRKVRKRGND